MRPNNSKILAILVLGYSTATVESKRQKSDFFSTSSFAIKNAGVTLTTNLKLET